MSAAAEEVVILGLVERAVDVILAALVPTRGHPGHVHVDAVAVDDGGDGVEESERVLPGFRGDGCGEGGAGQRPGGDDRRTFGQGVDAFAHDGDVRMRVDRSRDFGGERFPVDGEGRAGGDAMRVRRAQDQRAEPTHLLMEQADRVMVRVVGAKAVRTHHFGEAVGFMRWRHVAATAHFAEAHGQASLGELPRRLASGEAATDDMDVEGHGASSNACPT